VEFALVLPLLLLAMTNPFDRWVSARDLQAAEALVARVAAEPGEVWIPYHGWVNVVAGKPPHIALFCVEEWTASGREHPRSVLEALEQQDFSLVITGLDTLSQLAHDVSQEPFHTLAKHYRPVDHIPLAEAFVDKDGWASAPRVLWRPQP
jgi:hypothetical protein